MTHQTSFNEGGGVSGGHFEPVTQMRRLEVVALPPFDSKPKANSQFDLLPVVFCLPSNPAVGLDEAYSRLHEPTNHSEAEGSCDDELDSFDEEKFVEVMKKEKKQSEVPERDKKSSGDKRRQRRKNSKQDLTAEIRSEKSVTHRPKSSRRRRSLGDPDFSDGQQVRETDSQLSEVSGHRAAPRYTRTPVERPSNPTPSAASAKRSTSAVEKRSTGEGAQRSSSVDEQRLRGQRPKEENGVREGRDKERERKYSVDKRNELVRRLREEREKEKDRELQRQAAQCIINAYNQAYKQVDNQKYKQKHSRDYKDTQSDRERDRQRYEKGTDTYRNASLEELLKKLTPEQHRQVRKALDQEIQLYRKS